MVRTTEIVILGCLLISLTGCGDQEQDKPIWETMKIGDLAPSDAGRDQNGRVLQTANFNVHVFEVPAENVNDLEAVWEALYQRPLRFNSPAAFRANLFTARFAQVISWDSTANKLRAAGGRRVVTVSLLLDNGQSNDIPVAGLGRRQTVFHITSSGATEGTTTGPGSIVLRIKASRIAGARGVCDVDMYPAFSVPVAGTIPALTAQARAGEFPFAAAGLKLRMSPGDLVILGPAKYSNDRMTLGSLFFSKPDGGLFPDEDEWKPPKLRPAVRVFVLVCTAISY